MSLCDVINGRFIFLFRGNNYPCAECSKGNYGCAACCTDIKGLAKKYKNQTTIPTVRCLVNEATSNIDPLWLFVAFLVAFFAGVIVTVLFKKYAPPSLYDRYIKKARRTNIEEQTSLGETRLSFNSQILNDQQNQVYATDVDDDQTPVQQDSDDHQTPTDADDDQTPAQQATSAISTQHYPMNIQ